jgi:hypothetical protein
MKLRPWALPCAVLLWVAGCGNPPDLVLGVREVGLIPDPPGAGGRDVGFSVKFGGHSVWIFGDTFFADAAADGYRWRSSGWSYTDDLDASDGLTGWTHAVDGNGKPLQLLPHTAAEQAFDDAHNGTPCPAANDCGARRTPSPGAVVVDEPSGRALVFYSKEATEPSGSYSFQAQGSSVATWASPAQPAVRPAVRPELTDPTLLFTSEEPPFGAAAVVAGDKLYAYACPGGSLSNPCRVGRAPLASALDRSAWSFYAGSDWSSDLSAASAVFEGAPLFTVHYSPYLGKYVAFYLVPLGTDMALRTADRPEGPWSDAEHFGQALPALDGTWDYALAAHPELARDGGRIEYLSYFRPGTFLDGTIHLLEVTLR